MGKRDDVDFEDFVGASWSSLFRTAFLLMGDYHLAEDVLQSALAKVYVVWVRAWRSGDAPGGNGSGVPWSALVRSRRQSPLWAEASGTWLGKTTSHISRHHHRNTTALTCPSGTAQQAPSGMPTVSCMTTKRPSVSIPGRRPTLPSFRAAFSSVTVLAR